MYILTVNKDLYILENSYILYLLTPRGLTSNGLTSNGLLQNACLSKLFSSTLAIERFHINIYRRLRFKTVEQLIMTHSMPLIVLKFKDEA